GAKRVAALAAGGRQARVAEATRVLEEDVRANRAIGERGAAILEGRRRILTHCNAGALAGTEWGTALSIVRVLHERGGISEVFVGETRPLLQGSRLTAWELGRMGVPHRVIVDGAGPGLILTGGVRIAPERSSALNLAFDVTPVDLVTAIVTESRVIYPGTDPILTRP